MRRSVRYLLASADYFCFNHTCAFDRPLDGSMPLIWANPWLSAREIADQVHVDSACGIAPVFQVLQVDDEFKTCDDHLSKCRSNAGKIDPAKRCALCF